MSHLMYWARGNPVDAKFPGLKNKTVAVVCFDTNLTGPGNVADALAKSVGSKLALNVPKIKVVEHQKVTDWIDEQSDHVADFKDVGRGVKADMVVGIDMDDFRIHDGATLLRGRSRISVKVYDLSKGGEVVYQTPVDNVTYPENGPRPVTDNEGAFRSLFLDILAKRISKDFYPYDKAEDFGLDGLYTGD
ncbi:hypothetical protein [Anatilimnocola aggregata]|nr:hypothetical protein [Anatilimnocola aggregata]